MLDGVPRAWTPLRDAAAPASLTLANLAGMYGRAFDQVQVRVGGVLALSSSAFERYLNPKPYTPNPQP